MMSLPPEILDNILCFLQSDLATLRACAQSHPILSQLTERYLYINVTVQDNIVHGQDDFCQILHDRPHIANYVRVLEIKSGRRWGDSRSFLDDISPFLPTMSKLRRIVLSFASPWKFGCEIPEKFRLALSDCLSLPSITDICTEDIPFPLSTLSHCKHIRYLSLKGWYYDGEFIDTATLPPIDYLALHICNPDSVSPIVGWIQSRNLSSLEYSNNSLAELPQILMSCSHSLTSLDVNIARTYETWYDFESNITYDPNDAIPIPLALLPNLQRLTIRAQQFYGYLGVYSPIPAIAQILKPASPRALQCLTLAFLFFMIPYEHHSPDILCGPLHSLLVQSASTVDSIDLRVKSLRGSVPADDILSLFASYSHLIQFVEDGRLILTPVVENSSIL